MVVIQGAEWRCGRHFAEVLVTVEAATPNVAWRGYGPPDCYVGPACTPFGVADVEIQLTGGEWSLVQWRARV